MSTMLKEVYDALKEAGASEEKASAAAVAVAAYQLDRTQLAAKNDIARLESEIAALDKRLAVIETRLIHVEASLSRVEKLQWAIVLGVIATAIRVWFHVP